MRFVKKMNEPAELVRWKNENREFPAQLAYKNLPAPVKAVIIRQLQQEQGFLCAYTMCRIDNNRCHIEHFLPQHAFPRSDVEYQNLLACFPNKEEYGRKLGACPYGADYKGQSLETICNPTVASQVQGAFTFGPAGNVIGNTELARKTIEVLNLNHPELVQARRNTIARVMGIRARGGRSLLTAKAASRLIREQRCFDKNGKLPPFCEAVAQCLERYVKKEVSRSQRMKKEH